MYFKVSKISHKATHTPTARSKYYEVLVYKLSCSLFLFPRAGIVINHYKSRCDAPIKIDILQMFSSTRDFAMIF